MRIMENDDIIHLLREEKKLEAFIKQYKDKELSQGLNDKEKTYYEEMKRYLAEIKRRKNHAY